MKFKVRLQPRSSQNKVVGWEGEALKVKVSAPPVEGAANVALTELLSKTFRIAKTRIQIVSGASSRNKTVEISGADAELERTIKNHA